jgi:hypothetical protein
MINLRLLQVAVNRFCSNCGEDFKAGQMCAVKVGQWLERANAGGGWAGILFLEVRQGWSDRRWDEDSE